MPKRTVTKIQYDCDICGKTFDGEPSSVFQINTGGDGRDCSSAVRIIVQAKYSYVYSFEESTICDNCKWDIIERFVKSRGTK